MNSVFSHYLEPLVEAGIIETNPTKPSEIISQMRASYNQGIAGIIDNTTVVAFDLHEGEINDDIVYEVWSNPGLHKLVNWINKSIILNLDKDSWETTEVKIRIATGMLNKIQNTINPCLAGYIFLNFVENIKHERGEIAFEDLPF